MSLSSADRIAFSSAIVSATAQSKAIVKAQGQLQSSIVSLQALDTANKNLFTPNNSLVNGYQAELSALDGNGRTTISEQDIQDAANKRFQNHFFPNDVNTSVPSIASLHNIWPYISPYGLNFAIGKNYSEAYTTVTKEGDDISAITTQVSAAIGSYTDYELTTGTLPNPGTCSISGHTDEASCVAAGGTWTPGTGYSPSPAIVTIKNNLVTAVNTLLAFLNTEVGLIVTTDTTSPNQANNAAAIANINTVIIPALNAWLAYADFESTGAGPSKLHSTQLNALTTALGNRLTFITTRISQILTVLGTITQDISTGIATGMGLYFTRYGLLSLRLHALNGSLTKLASAQASNNAQTSILENINTTAATYSAILPTTPLASSANGTQSISAIDATLFAPGDMVFIVADNQPELQRAIKSISGSLITLNDTIPAKYSTAISARIYKDLT